MSQPLLVLDVHYLCYRAFHASGGLEWHGKATGAIFGFLQAISFLKERFCTDRVAFCFEHSQLRRRVIFPDYKKARRTKPMTEEETRARSQLHVQINELRMRHLPIIGFRNIFQVPGMESDDLMASLAFNAPKEEDVILVTSDADLWQCLRDNVSIWDPARKRQLTREWFVREHGYIPRCWARVKAMAGCDSDGVPGIVGIGEITAEKEILGTLNPGSAAWRKIHSVEGRVCIKRNKALVRLPFEGCPNIYERLVEDEFVMEGWRKICTQLGFRSILTKPPVAPRKMGGLL